MAEGHAGVRRAECGRAPRGGGKKSRGAQAGEGARRARADALVGAGARENVRARARARACCVLVCLSGGGGLKWAEGPGGGLRAGHAVRPGRVLRAPGLAALPERRA